jgi:hypothetical protein
MSSADNFWNPRPQAHYDNLVARDAYRAGYSDAYHRYPHGSGVDYLTPAYRTGWSDGENDRLLAEGCAYYEIDAADVPDHLLDFQSGPPVSLARAMRSELPEA